MVRLIGGFLGIMQTRAVGSILMGITKLKKYIRNVGEYDMKRILVGLLLAPAIVQGAEQLLVTTSLINVPGNYYLGYDILSTVTIDASSVVLNLNGNTIVGGVSLTSTSTAVIIRDGFISADGLVGVDLPSGVQDIALENLLILGSSVGVNAAGTGLSPIKRLGVVNVVVEGATTNGIQMSNCQGFVIADSLFNRSQTGYGGLLSSCTQGKIVNCSFNNNGLGALSGLSLQSCSNIEIDDTVARSNNENGFDVDAATSGVIASNCVASNNTLTGFAIAGQADLYGCTASNNTVDGFALSGLLDSLVKQCTAANNGACGFNDATGAGSAVRYGGNLAYANTTDFCGSAGAGTPPFNYVTSLAGATFWDNIQG
jgi:hypothetical protein